MRARRAGLKQAALAAVGVTSVASVSLSPPVLHAQVVMAPASTHAVCDPATPATCTLEELGAMLGVRIGTTIEPDEVVDAEYTETLLREFNSVTPENAFKWYSIQPTEGAFAYASADTVLEFATTHHLAFRAHTLVWAQNTYTPTWVRDIADPVDLRAAVVSHITAVMSRYADRVDR